MATDVKTRHRADSTLGGRRSSGDALAAILGTLLLVTGLVISSGAGALDEQQLAAIGSIVAGFAALLRIERVREIARSALLPAHRSSQT